MQLQPPADPGLSGPTLSRTHPRTGRPREQHGRKEGPRLPWRVRRAAGAGADGPAGGRAGRAHAGATQPARGSGITEEQNVPVLPVAAAKCAFFPGRGGVEGIRLVAPAPTSGYLRGGCRVQEARAYW